MSKKYYFSGWQHGFTLVELLVVISILGILAAALTTQVTKARSMGQTIRCKANLRNLAQAALSYSISTEEYPNAGSYEWLHISHSTGSWRPCYLERKGWVSWTGNVKWSTSVQQSQRGSTKPACFYGDESAAYYSITNGSLWSYAGRDLSVYLCDTHKAAAKRAGLTNVRRSYVMNSFFSYDYVPDKKTVPQRDPVSVSELSDHGNAAGLLLFAELPAFQLTGSQFTENVEKGTALADGVLEAKIKGYNTGISSEETIGFNHLTGGRFTGHVAFADGHVDVVIAPPSPSAQKLADLTYLLCNGVDVPVDSGAWSTARSEH